MEELYRNPLLTIALSILALVMIGNSGIQLYGFLNCLFFRALRHGT